MVFFVGTLTHEGGKGLLRCTLEEEKIVELEALSLTDPTYLIKVDGRLFSISSDIEGEFRGCVNEISTDGKMKVIAAVLWVAIYRVSFALRGLSFLVLCQLRYRFHFGVFC